jgi:LysM repeat protein
MALSYTIQRGDSLSKIAAKFGVASWQLIYTAPENAAFRRKHPDPNRIFPGEVLIIPGVTTTAAAFRLCNRPEPPANLLAAAPFLLRVR